MTKIKTVKKNLDVTKIECQAYDKNQGYQEKIKPRYKKIKITEKKKLKIVIKIKVFKKILNKAMTKIEVVKKKIEGSYDKNQGCLEKKKFLSGNLLKRFDANKQISLSLSLSLT